MARIIGRAYVFMRWGGLHPVPGSLGQVGWAFEYNDRLGRLSSFYCGSTEYRASSAQGASRIFWFDKCASLTELIKTMSSTAERAAFDEVKVFEVSDAQSELALQTVNQLAAASEEVLSRTDPLEHTREILSRYGVRSVAHWRGFNGPFLWYNMLPGRSVPVRKLAVHVFQVRAANTVDEALNPAEIEERTRKAAQADHDIRSVGECVVCRSGTRFIVGLTIAVDPSLSVGEGRTVAERLEQAIRNNARAVTHVFVQVEPFDHLS